MSALSDAINEICHEYDIEPRTRADRFRADLQDLVEREIVATQEAVSMLRSQLQLARIFVEGKALTPDTNVLLGIDHVLATTKERARW